MGVLFSLPTEPVGMIFKRLLSSAILVLFLFSSYTIADTGNATLKLQLIQSQRHLVAVMAYFQLYQTSHGDAQYTQALTHHLLACKHQLESLRIELAKFGLEKEAGDLQSQWNYMAQSLNSSMASLKRGGFLEQTVEHRYRQSVIALYQSLIQMDLRLFKADQPQSWPQWERVAQLGLLMQQMSLRYLDNSWSVAGVQSSLSLEQMALIFDRQLQRLEQTEDKQAAIAILRDVRSKWNVLGTAMISDPDHPVTYLVTRYGNDIVEQMQSLLNLD